MTIIGEAIVAPADLCYALPAPDPGRREGKAQRLPVSSRACVSNALATPTPRSLISG